MSAPQTVSGIDDIEVGNRHRHDLGDISGLAASIDEVGLLHPVVVTRDNVLVAGERRLAACRSLGWDEVPVTIAESDVQVVSTLAGQFPFPKDRGLRPSEAARLRSDTRRALQRFQATIGIGSRPTAVYRLYSADHHLLYVGIAVDPGRRFTQHRADKPWWRDVVSRTVEWYESRTLALDVEGDAIHLESPVFNIAGVIA